VPRGGSGVKAPPLAARAQVAQAVRGQSENALLKVVPAAGGNVQEGIQSQSDKASNLKVDN